MKTKILKIKGDWEEVVDDCRSTVNKPPLGHEPSSEFKKSILIAEHDPIRDITVKFIWEQIPYWVAMHWKTHIWRSRTTTQRNDRQEIYDRTKASQDSPVDFVGDMNAQHSIDTMKKRLCYMAASETRKYAEDYKITLKDMEPELSDVLVPSCVYRAFCPEPNGCGFWNRFSENLTKDEIVDYETRYKKYNEWFYSNHQKEE